MEFYQKNPSQNILQENNNNEKKTFIFKNGKINVYFENEDIIRIQNTVGDEIVFDINKPLKDQLEILSFSNNKEKQKNEKISWQNFESGPTQIRTLKNVRNTLKESLLRKYKIEKEEVLDELLKIQGLHKDNFDFLGNIEKFLLQQKINDFSINDNANKSEKSVRSIIAEVEAPLEKILGFDFLYQTMKGMYGKKEAKRLSGELYDFSLAIADSTKILLPYCYSIDASKLVLVGRNFGVLKSKPPKRITSYVAALCETIHQLSNHLAGAIAIGTFFLDISHILIFRQKISYEDLKNNKNIRKSLEDTFQGFIHSVNHLSREGTESPFTNLSIFDTPKLQSLLADSNMGWYFSESFFEIYKQSKEDFKDELTKDYVVEYIKEVQRIFLNFFDKGDPSADGLIYRFPVITINFSKEKIFDEETQTYKYKIIDQNFLNEFVNNYDVYKYNIFVSEGTKVASCCYSGDEIVEILNKKTNEIMKISLKDFILKYMVDFRSKEQLIGFSSIEIPFDNDNYEIMSFNVRENKKEWSKIKGALIKKNDYYILIKIVVNDDVIYLTPDNPIIIKEKITGKLVEDIAINLVYRYNEVLFPVYNKEKESIEFENIKTVEKIENYTDIVYDIQLEKNHYFSLNNLISHNCRLINDSDLLDLASSVNSFGGGTNISLGSHRVVTINFNRIALEANSFGEFWEILEKRIEDTAKILKAHKNLLLEGVKRGLHSFISNGWINLNKMFSTFGIMGEVECIETLYNKFNIESEDLLYDILFFLNKKVLEYSQKYDIIGNIEVIPGESMAVRLAKVDRLLFGEENVPYELYSNQFIPLWKDVDVFERLEKDGKYNKLITGGGIVHIQLGEVIKSSILKTFIEFATECECEHFALNGVYSFCEKNHTTLGKFEYCPSCNSKIKDYYTRIVGFFTPVSNWGKERREKDFNNRKFVKINK